MGRGDGRGLRGHPGALDHAAGPFELLHSTTIQEDFDAQPPQPFRARGRSGVDADHPFVACGEQAGGRLARAGEADDQIRARWDRRTRLCEVHIG